MQQRTDTSPEAERALAQYYRDMPFERKWQLMGELYQQARTSHASSFLRRNPNATQDEIRDDWVKMTLDDELYQVWKKAVMERRSSGQEVRP